MKGSEGIKFVVISVEDEVPVGMGGGTEAGNDVCGAEAGGWLEGGGAGAAGGTGEG